MAPAGSIDPLSPEEWHARYAEQRKSLPRWLPARIKQLETEREQLLEQIDTLPQHEPRRLTQRRGYHSPMDDPAAADADSFHHLVADFVFIPGLTAIGMVPAFDPADPLGRTYAFPRRFKIEMLEGINGWEDDKWVPREGTEWVELVNWLDEDYPDPGQYPVVFSDLGRVVSKVRLSVPKSYADPGFFALGEIYLIREQDGEIADNMSVWGSTGIDFTVSDSLSVKPVWDLEYVYDGLSGLGLPLSEETYDNPDFVVGFDGSHAGNPVQIVLDLGQKMRLGRIELWPTEAPKKMAVPLFGFPGSVQAELSNDPDFREATTIVAENVREKTHNENLLTLICVGVEARYIRLTFDQLSEFAGKPILGLGEISVLEFGKVLSLGCDVSSSGIPDASLVQLPRLVDGFSRHRRIISETDWIIGLARRRPLDARLGVVESELAEATEKWNNLLFRISVAGGIILFLASLSAWIYQQRVRHRELYQLRQRITRDLHDEVGSSLGSISLTSEQLEAAEPDGEIKEQLAELSLMAREASASLREVVWMTDQKSIRLPALIDKLIERIERVLHDLTVTVSIPPDCPDVEVSLIVKRHLIMFFKEAIHNCARHARATRVEVGVATDNDNLQVFISDNGCGFDPRQKQVGWGLDSMNKRANELGGRLEIVSGMGQGSSIRLTVPMGNLSIAPTSDYKTSN